MAQRRGSEVARAVEAFRDTHGEYPARLESLVPEFLPSVPLPKYTLVFNRFHYIRTKETADLFYVVMPPFGRREYVFETKQWRDFD